MNALFWDFPFLRALLSLAAQLSSLLSVKEWRQWKWAPASTLAFSFGLLTFRQPLMWVTWLSLSLSRLPIWATTVASLNSDHFTVLSCLPVCTTFPTGPLCSKPSSNTGAARAGLFLLLPAPQPPKCCGKRLRFCFVPLWWRPSSLLVHVFLSFSLILSVQD